MLPSPSALPLTSSSSATLATATSIAGSEHTKPLTWHTALYLMVALVFVAVVAGIIWLIWNDPCIPSTPRHRKMEQMGTDSAFHFPSASTLVQRMCRYFIATLWPALWNLRQVTATSLDDASVGTVRRPQQALPLYVPHEFREPRLAAPCPAMPRDTSSFRVQSNPYSGSDPSSWPPASPYPLPVIPGLPGSAP